MNNPERLLDAAIAFYHDAAVGFDDLAITAWVRYPTAFGMANHSYPDTRAVANTLYGSRGAIGIGWIAKQGDMFLVTDAGRKYFADNMTTPIPEKKPARFVLNGHQADTLRWLFATRVWGFRDDLQRLSRADAFAFLDIDTINGHWLDALADKLGDKEAELNGGFVITAATVRELRQLHTALSKRFQKRKVTA